MLFEALIFRQEKVGCDVVTFPRDSCQNIFEENFLVEIVRFKFCVKNFIYPGLKNFKMLSLKFLSSGK